MKKRHLHLFESTEVPN
ncbi:hypothetical protein MTR67_023976 [Solanum verrucosum]|uniref:Uncharacterized protein n=1 Tax=Solanum verrucosum TaxID=315347 RepID=A0AAF0TSA3_SOLVR|nr:hypothetical protein MTR67_023976 [Solanum verrucosum]